MATAKTLSPRGLKILKTIHIILAAKTKWGFFKHRWITVKWILTIIFIIAGTFVMAPCVDANIYPSELIHTYSPENQEYLFNCHVNMVAGTIQVVCLFLVFALSVFKPKLKK